MNGMLSPVYGITNVFRAPRLPFENVAIALLQAWTHYLRGQRIHLPDTPL